MDLFNDLTERGKNMEFNSRMITESFKLLKPQADAVVAKFYETLFNDYPGSNALFARADMKKQKESLINSLVFIVENIDRGGKLFPYLKNLGARHVVYGMKNEHFDWVGKSLLKTFAFFLKNNWTPTLEKQWELAYGVIRDMMKEGAKELEVKKVA